MRVLRTINNNVVICLDNNENEVVAFGKGIGFKKKNNDIIELSKIDRTYYKVKTEYVDMIAHISQDILDVSIKIIDYCRSHLKKTINPNVIFTLADHINFAIKRYEENIDISLPIFKDVEHLYENEYAVGLFGLHTINKMLSESSPEVEAGMIALHIINAEISVGRNEEKRNEDMIQDIIKIIEQYLKINIDKNGFNYSRFVSHMNYLFKRGKKGKYIFSKNSEMYDTLIKCYPKTNRIVEKITIYLEDAMKCVLTDDEKIYLILHVNRLCTREDCLSNR